MQMIQKIHSKLKKKYGVFSEKNSHMIDRWYHSATKKLMWQSDTDLPQMYTGGSYQTLGKVNACEMEGIVILCLLSLSSREIGRKIEGSPFWLGKECAAAWIECFEFILMMEEFLKGRQKFTQTKLKKYEKMIPIFMGLFK